MLYASWVPGYVAAAENLGGGGAGSSDGPLKNFDGGPLGDFPMSDYQDVLGYRQGFGVRFRGKKAQAVWFHFAIPTPVVIRNGRARLSQVFVMWKTTGGSQLTAVHVWDGSRTPLATWDVNLSGNFSGNADQPGTDPKLVFRANQFPLPQDAPEVFYGVGISALVSFDANSDDSEIAFTSAGADFIGPDA